MALDSLGLTSDPRAVAVLIGALQNYAGFHRKTAALSLANIVANRVQSREAVPSLMSIAKDSTLDIMIRAQAINALCRFRKTDAEVQSFLAAIKEDEDADPSLRIAAM